MEAKRTRQGEWRATRGLARGGRHVVEDAPIGSGSRVRISYVHFVRLSPHPVTIPVFHEVESTEV